MKAEYLLKAIGLVDDDLIQEAEDYAPPARRTSFVRWRPLAGGLAAACLIVAALFYLPSSLTWDSNSNSTAGAAQEQESTSSQEDSGSQAGDTVGGAMEPSSPADQLPAADRILTPAGEYALTGETVSQLPQNSSQLGVLFLEGEGSKSQLYTSRKEYAGCMLWEGPDGVLYVQLPGEGYAVAQAAE